MTDCGYDSFFHQMADLLLEIESEMRRVGLWGHTPLPAAAFASRVPFCHDTMEFEQWLQWVLLPRMRQVVEQDDGWPNNSAILPLAEHRFAQLPHATSNLAEMLGLFDDLIVRRSVHRQQMVS